MTRRQLAGGTMHLEEEQEQELRELIQRLDRLVPRDGAHVLVPSGDDPHTSVGNRVGFLRLGIEILRGALTPQPGPEGAAPRVTPDIDDLVPADARTPFDVCELDESIGSRPPVESRLGPLGQVLAGVVVIGVVVAVLVVLARAWQLLFG